MWTCNCRTRCNLRRLLCDRYIQCILCGANYVFRHSVVIQRQWCLFKWSERKGQRQTALSEREREREGGGNWTDWISLVNTKGWALSSNRFLILQEDGAVCALGTKWKGTVHWVPDLRRLYLLQWGWCNISDVYRFVIIHRTWWSAWWIYPQCDLGRLWSHYYSLVTLTALTCRKTPR